MNIEKYKIKIKYEFAVCKKVKILGYKLDGWASILCISWIVDGAISSVGGHGFSIHK